MRAWSDEPGRGQENEGTVRGMRAGSVELGRGQRNEGRVIPQRS